MSIVYSAVDLFTWKVLITKIGFLRGSYSISCYGWIRVGPFISRLYDIYSCFCYRVLVCMLINGVISVILPRPVHLSMLVLISFPCTSDNSLSNQRTAFPLNYFNFFFFIEGRVNIAAVIIFFIIIYPPPSLLVCLSVCVFTCVFMCLSFFSLLSHSFFHPAIPYSFLSPHFPPLSHSLIFSLFFSPSLSLALILTSSSKTKHYKYSQFCSNSSTFHHKLPHCTVGSSLYRL